MICTKWLQNIYMGLLRLIISNQASAIHLPPLRTVRASEATKVTIKCNMHIDVRVIQVADLKFKVKFNILGYSRC